MPTGYHDDSNNPRYNFVPHLAAGDTQRGLPAVGKLVYRTDNDGLEVCTSTSPDPGQNGGGTWSPVAGPVWNASVAPMTGASQPTWGTSDLSIRRWCVIGDFCHVTWFFKFSSGFSPGGAGVWWNFTLPVAPNYYSIGAAAGMIYKPYVGYEVISCIMEQGTVGTSYVNLVAHQTGIVAEGTPWAWTVDSLGYFSLAYQTA